MRDQNAKIKKERWVVILSMVIGVLTLNVLASRHFARLDLTSQKIFTLAPATKDILKNLDDVVTLRLYFTPNLPPALAGIRRDVEDVLSEFKTYAKNRIQVEYLNPQESPIKEQQVQMMGIPTIEVNVIQKDKEELAKIYLGMTVNYSSRQEVLAVVQDTNNLEYRLAAAILKVTQPKKPVIGWWGPEEGDSYGVMMEQIKDRFEVRTIANKLDLLDSKEIPLLLFVVPEKLADIEKQTLQDYLSKGGKAILLLERVNVAMGQGLKPTSRQNPLEAFLKNYGIEVKQDLVLDHDNAMATFTGGLISYHLPYPYWVMIRPEGFEKREPMVAELGSLVIPWGSSIEIAEKIPEGTNITTLFKTTKFGTTSQNINPMVALDPQTARDAMSGGTTKEIPLGVLIDKKMIVIGNTALFQNNFLQQFQENNVFLGNMLDAFSIGDRLIGVRSKGLTREPLALVSDRARTAIKGVDLMMSPLLLMGLGAWVLFAKRRRAKTIQAIFGNKT